jgi:16S rRNA processing protein RimM
MSLMTALPRNEWVEIGVVARAHGVRGWVRVRLADPGSESLSSVKEVALGDPGRRVRLLGAEADAAGYRVHIEGIEDRDAAEALRGTPILVERRALPEPEAEEIYVADLIGCVVVDLEGRELGRVRAVHNWGAQELLAVALADGEEALVPMVEGIVTEVDVEGRRIVCDPPEGLLDLNRAPDRGVGGRAGAKDEAKAKSKR